MKKIVVLGAAGVILAGGYAGMWHLNAGHVKADAVAGLEKLKGFMAPGDVTYSSIDSSGFPGGIATSVNALKLNYANVIKMDIPSYTITRGIWCNTYADKFGGDIALTFGPFADKADAIELVYKASPDASSKLTLKGNQYLDFIKGKIGMDPIKGRQISPALLDDFSAFEVKASHYEILDKKTGKPLLKSGPVQMKIKADRLDESSHKISFQVSVVDQEATPDADLFINKLLGEYKDTLQAFTGNPFMGLNISRASANGKENVELDVSYSGVTDPNVLGQKDISMDFQINKYNAKNNLLAAKMNGGFSLKMNKEKQPTDVSVKFDGTMQASAAFTENLKVVLKDLATNMAAAENQEGAEQQLVKTSAVMAKMAGLLPDMHTWGEIKESVDLTYNEASKNFELKTLSIMTDKFGMAFSGAANMSDAAKPKAHLDIQLKNYDVIVSGLFDTASQVIEMMKEENGGQAPFNLDPELKKNFTAFLEKIAEKHEPGAKDLTIKISADGDQVKVGNMNGGEAMMSLMMLMAPKA